MRRPKRFGVDLASDRHKHQLLLLEMRHGHHALARLDHDLDALEHCLVLFVDPVHRAEDAGLHKLHLELMVGGRVVLAVIDLHRVGLGGVLAPLAVDERSRFHLAEHAVHAQDHVAFLKANHLGVGLVRLSHNVLALS